MKRKTKVKKQAIKNPDSLSINGITFVGVEAKRARRQFGFKKSRYGLEGNRFECNKCFLDFGSHLRLTCPGEF